VSAFWASLAGQKPMALDSGSRPSVFLGSVPKCLAPGLMEALNPSGDGSAAKAYAWRS